MVESHVANPDPDARDVGRLACALGLPVADVLCEAENTAVFEPSGR